MKNFRFNTEALDWMLKHSVPLAPPIPKDLHKRRNARLTEEQVLTIFKLAEEGIRRRSIAQQLLVSKGSVSGVLDGGNGVRTVLLKRRLEQ